MIQKAIVCILYNSCMQAKCWCSERLVEHGLCDSTSLAVSCTQALIPQALIVVFNRLCGKICRSRSPLQQVQSTVTKTRTGLGDGLEMDWSISHS